MAPSIGTTPVSKVAIKQLVTVGPTDKLEAIASLFESKQISAAPVVDGMEKCVGIITSSDVVRYESLRNTLNEQFPQGLAFDMTEPAGDQPLEFQDRPFDEAAYHMSQEFATIDAAAPLSRAARQMCRQRIHHLVLLDTAGRPQGILSALDILAEQLGEPVGAGQSDSAS